MDVRPWQDTLDALTQPDGWIGRRDSKADRAYTVLAGYDQPNGWIAHGIPANRVDQPDGTVAAIKPDAAYAAELKRDAILQLAVLHELHQADSRRPASEPGVAELMRKVVYAAMTAPMGLRAKSVKAQEAKPYTEVDFAHGENAKKFFEDVVRPRLLRVDASTGVGLATNLPSAYEPNDEDTIEQWGRVWTAGVALAPLDWARAKGCRTLRDIARALWCASNPAGGALNGFHPSAALIPTERKLVLTAHAELRTCAAIAYSFAGNEQIRQVAAQQPTDLSLALRALSDARRVGEEKRYDGYNRTHLYLSVWSDSLRVANGTPAMPARDPPLTSSASGELGAPGTLAPEQQAALAQTAAARVNLQAMSKAMTPARRFYASGPVRPAAVPNSADSVASAAVEWEPVSQGSLRLLLAHAVPGARWQPIGSIDLWRELGPEVDWIDLLVVARIDDRQVPLPVTMDDEAIDDNGAGRSLLVLDEGASPALSAEALRRALQVTDALVGVVVRKSLGAFVVLEIDMNAQQGGAVGV